MKKILSLVTAALLAVLMLTAFAGCAKDAAKKDDGKDEPKAEITITVDVVKSDKTTKTFTVKTGADNLEDALLGEKLIEGTEGDYGLFITTVDGEVADYEKDKAYWSIQQDGVALNTGAKDTKIADGDKYDIVYTIG